MIRTLKINKYTKGMTLVELIVVLGIFILVAGLTMFDYSRFRSSVSVQNLADDIALSIRRAQNYAIGVQNVGATFDGGYGIHFSTVSSQSFIIFSDANPNKSYDDGGGCGSVTPSNECLEILTINSGDKIVSICPDSNCGASDVDIVFIRPEPDAYICVGGSCGASSVDIIVKDVRNENTKTITVTRVGQISVR